MVLRNEHLSDAAIGLVDMAPHGCSQLVVTAPVSPAIRTHLAAIAPADLLRGPLVNPAMAQCVLCGLWLWHDFLDEAHTLAQADTTVTGSLWHAIMHRRQGDFANSKYWYAKCQRHFILGPLAQHVSVMTNTLPADTRLLRLTLSGWDAVAFVDLVQDVAAAPADPLHALAVEIQQLEWRLLLEHCAAQSVEGT